jgi:predicted nucleic acid-binding protein
VDDLLDYFCKVAHHPQIFYLWRPRLPDPKDDMVLELAVAARAEAIVTAKVRAFAGAQKFGVSVLEPTPFLTRVGVAP